MSLKKVNKWLDIINNYYAFALLISGAIAFVYRNNYLLLVLGCTVPPLAVWTGYLLRGYFDRRSQRRGFYVIADSISYEIGKKNTYTLHYKTKVKAAWNHLMVYPIGYQWTGSGEEGIPKVTGKGQQLLTAYQPVGKRGKAVKVRPYESTALSTEGDWHYWFIALNPPLHRNQVIEIKYSQDFVDKTGAARPYLYHFVRTPIEKLELSIHFNDGKLPKKVTGSYIKPSDSGRPYNKKGVIYDRDKQWATWVIHNPKKGYCYRIHWE